MESSHIIPSTSRGIGPTVPQRASTPHFLPSPSTNQYIGSPVRLPSTPENRKKRRSARRFENKAAPSVKQDTICTLSKPLSVIAAEAPQIKVEDASEFVHRSVEVRRQEARVFGKVKRPLNAFMLYRKAFQNVAKIHSTRNNHQHISSICGESWSSKEPRDIVDKFNELAAIERRMHEQAFPDYRYDPVVSKSRTTAPSLATTEKRPIWTECGGVRNPIPRNLAEVYDDHPAWSNSPHSHPQPWVGQIRGSVQPQTHFEDSAPLSSHAPILSTDPISTGFMHGSFYTEPPVDPSLLPYGQMQAAYPGLEPAMALSTNWPVWSVFPDQFGDSIPDLDLYGSHNQYLRGVENDWEVEKLVPGTENEIRR